MILTNAIHHHCNLESVCTMYSEHIGGVVQSQLHSMLQAHPYRGTSVGIIISVRLQREAFK